MVDYIMEGLLALTLGNFVWFLAFGCAFTIYRIFFPLPGNGGEHGMLLARSFVRDISKPESLDFFEKTVRAKRESHGEIEVKIVAEAARYISIVIAIACFVAFLLFMVWERVSLPFPVKLAILIVLPLSSLVLADRLKFHERFRTRWAMRRAVAEAAKNEFIYSPLISNRANAGILIFVSVAEHRVVLFIGRGIAPRVSRRIWNEIVDEIATGIDRGNIEDAISTAISICTDQLIECLPANESIPDPIPF